MAVLRKPGLLSRIKRQGVSAAGASMAHKAGRYAHEKTGGATPALKNAVAMYRFRTLPREIG